ncbi:PEP-CTERM protein-sorting domain [Comamonadaceae bacterium]
MKLIKRMIAAVLMFAAIGSSSAASLDVGTYGGNSCCSDMTRGYVFTAPIDFYINEVFLPVAGGTGSTLQLLKFDSVPPEWSSTTNSFSSLGFWADSQSSGAINIAVHAGDVIGVLGWSATLQATPYHGQAGSYASSINGNAVSLQRIGFQARGLAHDVWKEENYYIGTIGLNYSTAPVPEPETYAMLLVGLGVMGAVARRRKSKHTA